MLTTLEVLFSSMARVRILRLFLMNPSSQFYQREIERETEQPIRAVQREVERLEGIGLLIRSEEGNRVFYRLNRDFAFAQELCTLFSSALGEKASEPVPSGAPSPPLEPSAIAQPFPWMETPPVAGLPASLRRMQSEAEWDKAY